MAFVANENVYPTDDIDIEWELCTIKAKHHIHRAGAEATDGSPIRQHFHRDAREILRFYNFIISI